MRSFHESEIRGFLLRMRSFVRCFGSIRRMISFGQSLQSALHTQVCSSAPFSHAESQQAAPRKARTSHMQGNLHVWFWPGTPKLIELPFDLPEAEAESVAGYNVEYARDAILNSPLLAEANVPGSRGLILTETRGGSLPIRDFSQK
ncbi:uncharacterized protein LOC127147824, partial [Cucumis melo]|uniref:Uncharacterized protein LOC127147824 n=1 Tax=Cucumis melo TaxID=3656 RepID=A0ABM3KGF7_CUCME